MPSLSDWFFVRCDADGVALDVRPPGGEAWTDRFAWIDVNRVCFKAGGPFDSDEYYVFTATRPESYVIPSEAAGVSDLLDALMARRHFPAEVAIEAATLSEGEIVCWPKAE